MSEIFVVRDPSYVCGICGVMGHDTNLTGNTPMTALLGCVKELKDLVTLYKAENLRLRMETKS